jgi:hypothetical protein
MPVEFGIRDTPFTLHTIPHKPNAKLYLCTDGYADQFVAPKGIKFKYKQLNELILSHSNEQMQTQANKIENNLTVWQGVLEQVMIFLSLVLTYNYEININFLINR